MVRILRRKNRNENVQKEMRGSQKTNQDMIATI